MSDVIEIGYFQLENLQLNNLPFIFLDLRLETSTVHDEPLKTLLASAVPLKVSEVQGYLAEKGSEKTLPIVLMCEDGIRAKQSAEELERKGYINVHIIEGGFKALGEEAQAVTHS